MKIALKSGEILIKDANSVQSQVIKSWGKMKWNRATQTLNGPVEADLLNQIASMVRLPDPIEKERQRLNNIVQAVDRERLNPTPIPLIKPPIKVRPFSHQVRAYNMALLIFELVEAEEKMQGKGVM